MILFILSSVPLALSLLPRVFSISFLRWLNLIYSLLFLIFVTDFILNYSYYNIDSIVSWVLMDNWVIHMGYDGISLGFVWLTVFLYPICLLSVWGNVYKMRLLLLLLNMIQFFLVGSFLSFDLLTFYILFESILIPMFLIIGIWGSRSDKVKAAYYLFLYTLVGSILFLISILILQSTTGSTSSLYIEISKDWQYILWIMFFIAFAVKIPMFPFHIWLPEAHVEAPTVGSVILAALLLKLGGYGYLRFMLPLFDEEVHQYYWPVILLLAGCSIIFASLSAIRQVDLKRIIAYSSIAHMNLAVLGIFSGNYQALNGGFTLMLAHGFVSGALFLLIGVLYDRYHSRLVSHYSGIAQVAPLFAFFFIVFSLANIGFPLSYNYIGEISIVVGLMAKHFMYAAIAGIGILLSVVYVMWLVNRVLFGAVSVKYISQFYDINFREFLIFVLLLIPTVVFGIFPSYLDVLFQNSLLSLLIFT